MLKLMNGLQHDFKRYQLKPRLWKQHNNLMVLTLQC